jgi:predicted nucleic acid-binding protein
MIILDTDVLSAVMGSEQVVTAWLNRQPSLSIWTTTITILEIRYGLTIMPVGRRRTMRERAFEDVIEKDLENRILVFDRAAADQAASLMAIRHRAGRPRDTRDSMIAGIALANRAVIATRNARHFDDLDLPVVNPWDA